MTDEPVRRTCAFVELIAREMRARGAADEQSFYQIKTRLLPERQQPNAVAATEITWRDVKSLV